MAILGVLLAAILVAQATAFEFKECDDTGENILNIINLDIKPDPLIIPGKAQGIVKLQVNSDVGEGTELRADVKRHVSFMGDTFKVPVPCLNNIGSCVYDTCTVLKKLEKFLKPHWPVDKPYSCPITSGVYGDDSVKEVDLPAIEMLYEFTEAKYDLEIAGYSGDKRLGCFFFSTTLKVPE